jgi:hypothetical protein
LLTLWRGHKGESGEYIYENELGNLAYEADDYQAAETHYRAAVAAAPERPILRSNHALACEKLRTETMRLAWLGTAIASLEHAVTLDPKEPAYSSRLQRLIAERNFIDAYGEAALDLLPIVVPIRVGVPRAILPELLNAELNALSDASLNGIECWRNRFRERWGVPVPGVRFSLLENAIRDDAFAISLMEEAEHWKNMNGRPALDAVLEELEPLCANRLADYLGHDETVGLLREMNSPEAAKIIEAPESLTTFVSVLRHLLLLRVSLPELTPVVLAYGALYREPMPTGLLVEQLLPHLAAGK